MHQIEAGILILPEIIKTANPLEIGFWFFTPGVWILTFSVVLLGLLLSGIHKNLNVKRFRNIGLIFATPVLVFNFLQFNNWPVFIITCVIICLASYGICYLVNKFTKYKILNDKLNFFIILGQGIDGIASSIAVSFFAFSEQHVVSNFIMQIHPLLFITIKLGLGVLIAYSIDDYIKEDNKKKNILMFIKVIIAILGLATGIASLLKLGII
jgi:uncharacterized membrane protein